MVLHLPKDKRKTAILAGIIGNVMEWYDFALYGYMASIISQLFFPSDDKVASLLATYGIFAAGFIMRPLGSGVFGWLGDTIGRSRTMLISVALMVIPTFCLGLLPTYETVGVFAPILLVIIRLIQGLSVGGEFSSSVTYLVETSPASQRGLSGSWANFGSISGMLLGSAVATAVTSLMAEPMIKDWGWRLPFLFGGVLGSFAILLRRHLPKSDQFVQHDEKREKSSPLKEAFTLNFKETMQAMLFASGYGVLFYIALVYLPTWMSEHAGVSLEHAMQMNTVAMVMLVPVIPLAGWISDRYIRRTHLISLSVVVMTLLAFPAFMWIDSAGKVAGTISQISLAMLIAIPCGVAPAMFVELFPTRDRLSGYSVAFNIGMGVIGGSTPMVVTWLISKTGYDIVPAAYVVIWSLISLGALFTIRDRSREPLS
ncbi:MAG: MHS family MFS transporter [Firmicutes bacterium]|nr:MHS family MFS transporter [Bacillota bacterium]